MNSVRYHQSKEDFSSETYRYPNMKIGAVSYLNTKPLIDTLVERLGSEDTLVLDLPSRLASRLSSSDIDIGLIPVVEFFRGPEARTRIDGSESPRESDEVNPYQILSNAMIGCKGIVRSVRLFFRKDPSLVRTLAVDEGSKTSIALSKVLLAEIYGLHPNTIPLSMTCEPDQIDADAVLVIGDRAMHPKRYKSFKSDWDLGQKWFEHTGLPFVFAMWVGRAECNTEDWRCRFEVARDEGVAKLSKLCDRYASTYRLTHSDCMEYLGSNLRFKMTREDLLGLRTFHAKAVKLGLLTNELRPTWPEIDEVAVAI
jgi:chorismate dehydratase